MRGQSATEFLMLAAFLLLLIIPITYSIFTEASESSRMIEAQVAVDTLADVANIVYYQAPGAKQVVTVSLPSGVEWANSYIGHPTEAGGYEINLQLYTQTGGTTDVFMPTKGEVRGEWPDSNGRYRFEVRKTPEGYVVLTPYWRTFLLSPESYTAEMRAGNATSFTLTATEIDGADRSLTLTPIGDIASWVTTGTGTLALDAASTNTTSVTITVPAAAEYGYYTGQLEVTDGEVTDSVYLTIIVVGEPAEQQTFDPNCRLDVNITAPLNTTYNSVPLALNFTVNDTLLWCGYSMDDLPPLEVSYNSTILVTNGAHKLELFCIGDSSCSGLDMEYFTVDVPDEEAALHCFDLGPIRAYNGTYDDILEEIRYSDNIRGDQWDIEFGQLTFIDIDWALVLPGDTQHIVIHNMSQTIEHTEDSNQMDAILQWRLWSGWGATVCSLDVGKADQNETCTLYGRNALQTPGRTDTLSTRITYLPHAASAHDAHVDWSEVVICYGEQIERLDIISPLNQTYGVNWAWFNVSSNALLNTALYSLDGAANQTLTLSLMNASKNVTGLTNGSHYVTFFGNDSYGNPMANTTWFSVGGVAADTTKPTITMASPLNQSYSVNYVYANASLSEAGSWCGYSLDGNANVTMTSLNSTYWYYNVTALTNAQHSMKFHCNDTSGNMNETATRWFNVSAAAADLTKPTITIVSPLNSSYYVNWAYANVTVDESASWCGYSLDSAANQTLTSLNASYWYKNLTALANGQHSVKLYCNDTAGNMNETSLRVFTVWSLPWTIDIWELDTDKPQPIDFTNGLNTTNNTWGVANASDGWDWIDDTYTSGGVCTHFNGNKYVSSADPTVATVVSSVNTSNYLEIEIGDYSGCASSGTNNSGAYGVEFVVTPDMYARLQNASSNATLSFGWLFDNVGFDNNDDIWVKARFGNSTTMTYLGSQTGGGNDDANKEILYQQAPSDTSGSYSTDVKSLITSSGDYYLELGAWVRNWGNNERGLFQFDNVNLVIY